MTDSTTYSCTVFAWPRYAGSANRAGPVVPNKRGGPTRPFAPEIPGTIWHTGQPAFVKISVIGSSPVTNDTISAVSVTGDATGGGVTGEGVRERRANTVPSNSATTISGVIDRSTIEPITETVQQGCHATQRHDRLSLTLYPTADSLTPAPTVGVTHFCLSAAQRNPIVRSSKFGSAENRAVVRSADGTSAHDPPRRTRFSPVIGPDGFLSGLF